jgi:hypothetical protein
MLESPNTESSQLSYKDLIPPPGMTPTETTDYVRNKVSSLLERIGRQELEKLIAKIPEGEFYYRYRNELPQPDPEPESAAMAREREKLQIKVKLNVMQKSSWNPTNLQWGTDDQKAITERMQRNVREQEEAQKRLLARFRELAGPGEDPYILTDEDVILARDNPS